MNYKVFKNSIKKRIIVSKKLTGILSLTLFSLVALAQNSNVTNAKLSYDDKEYKEAAEYIDKAIVHPKTMSKSKTWLYRGMIYSILGQKNQQEKSLMTALESLDKCIELNENSGYVSKAKNEKKTLYSGVFTVGVKKFSDKDFQTAISLFEICTKIDANNDLAYKNIGIAAFNIQDWNKLVENSDNWIKVNEKNIQPHLDKTSALYYSKKYEEVIKSADAGLVIDANNEDLLRNKSNALINLNKSAEAVSLYEKMLEINPKNAVALSNLGILYNGFYIGADTLGKKEEAKQHEAKSIEYFNKAIEVDENNETANFQIGSYYYNKAAKYYSAADKLNDKQKFDLADKEIAKGNDFIKKCIPYYVKVNEIVKKDPTRGEFDVDASQGLMTAYKKTKQYDKMDEIRLLLYGK